MSSKDALKVLIMLAVAFIAVGAYCYARVDLGMTSEEVNTALQHWISQASSLTVLIWLQLGVAALAALAYRIMQHRKEQQAKR